MKDFPSPSQPPIIASVEPYSPWYSLHASPHNWVPAAISFIAAVCFLVVGFFIHGGGFTAFLCVLLLGLIAAAGVTSAVVALIRAQRVQDRRLVILAAIGVAVNSPLLAWALRAIGIVAIAHFRLR
jgi:Sec-independent protein secretion pathway component TatC